MQSTLNFPESPAQPLRTGRLHWLWAAASLAATGAVTLTALAQAPAETTGQAGPPAAATEAADAIEPSAAAQSASEPAADWNHRRVAPGGVDGQLRRLAADLKLDASQQAKIRPILVAQREEMQRLQRDTQLAQAARQQRILALGDRTATQIRVQLTDAQRAQYIQPRTAVVVAQAGSSAARRPTAASTSGAVPARK
jgi:hypothetical protein